MPALEGLLTAMVTAFAPDGSVDEDATVAVARHLLDNGSDGLVVCGTTGEAATLDDEEHLAVIKLIFDEFSDEALIVGGVGSNDTRHARHLTEAAAAIGCHALLSVTPYYNRPNERGIIRHFEEVAAAGGGTPIVVYNIPTRTAVNMGPDLLARLAQIDGIEGLKQSNNDELQLIDGLTVMAGNDDALARTLDIGGAGGICVASHVVGNEMKQMFNEPDRRAEIDASLQDVYAALFCTASPAPTKAALERVGRPAGGLRLPLGECDDAERAIVRRALVGAGVLAEAHA
ncbi:MAG: 4-hydroxy-tetrahydrodipicolinate synthase [Solirubrobacteraceae bacterium]|nr:4-hydroxy-tetrahydrodipicolinate synthase [Solirubrobacteraceae bacterium]